MMAQAQCELHGYARMPVKAQKKSLKLAATISPAVVRCGVMATPKTAIAANIATPASRLFHSFPCSKINQAVRKAVTAMT